MTIQRIHEQVHSCMRINIEQHEIWQSVRISLWQDLEGTKGERMKYSQQGKLGYLLAWLLGIPIPILLVIFLLRGCN
jgi:hypothetical protein